MKLGYVLYVFLCIILDHLPEQPMQNVWTVLVSNSMAPTRRRAPGNKECVLWNAIIYPQQINGNTLASRR